MEMKNKRIELIHTSLKECLETLTVNDDNRQNNRIVNTLYNLDMKDHYVEK